MSSLAFMNKLEGKTAVVTGSSSGIGEAIALTLAKQGANVVVNYRRSKERAERVQEKIQAAGGNAIIVQADIASTDDIDRLIKETCEQYGVIDIWVNNAGADILTGDAVNWTREEKLSALIQVDLQGTINACWRIAPDMQAQGHGVIINNSWDLSTYGFQGTNPQMFAATKAGVLGFSRCLAHDYAPEVRVNIVSPGWIMTSFAEDDMANEYLQARIDEIPLSRFGTPDDIANAVMFLASDDAAYMTGAEIKVNGGLV